MFLVLLLVNAMVSSFANLGARAQDGLVSSIDEDSTVLSMNEAGATTEEEDSSDDDEFGIASYVKSKTQFDGVSSEMQVTYLHLTRDQGVEIPVLSTGTSNKNIDFTIMFWFKVDSAINNLQSPNQEQTLKYDHEIMQLFSFEDSAACFFTDQLSLMCDSWDRRKLQIPAQLITPGIWHHLTLSSSKDGESFLMIQTNFGIVAVDSTFDFGFRQNTFYAWKTCIGACTSDFGFAGGIRELIMLDQAVTMKQAIRAKNQVLTYNSSIKSYFRFQEHYNKFEKDEYVDWPWIKFKNLPDDRKDYVGLDIIPNDICPSLFEQITALRFSNESKTRLHTLELRDQLSQVKYAYTMSMTLMVNETACAAPTPSDAENDCNLVKLDGVFMLYLVGRNTARFHFFASKNYYESASKIIYLPYDQWITIQLSMDRFDGYQIVVADQNGNAFYRTRVQQNMQEQWPTNELMLLRSFDGFVEHFYLDDSFRALHPYYATDFRGEKDALFNVAFVKENFSSKFKFKNIGRHGGSFALTGEKDELRIPGLFQDVFFKVPSEGGSVAGTLDDESFEFDGIACNDRHMTTHFNESDSYIQFLTPRLDEWSKENTVEFWFKLRDPSLYTRSLSLFSMTSNEIKNPVSYYHIYIERGELKCAPFGTATYRDPVIVYTDFNQDNEDLYGWWHVSCSYAFQKTAKGTIFNTNIFQMLEETMVGLPKFYPPNQLKATFGKQPTIDQPGAEGALVKEFRFWNSQLTRELIENSRYRQIDPTMLPRDHLLVYLRLASGSSLIENLALKGKTSVQGELNLSQGGLTYVEDFIETERYSYDSQLELVIKQKQRTYHTVCPVHTYFMDQYCYSEPVNKVVLGIFPVWDMIEQKVDWEISMSFSSVIRKEVFQYLTEQVLSDDQIVNSYLAKKDNKQQLNYIVPSRAFRHESKYLFSASLTNEERTFFQQKNVNFVPSLCKWFTELGTSETQGFMTIEESPGKEDLTFQLELKRNPTIDCTPFDFYDSFIGMDFDFTMTDTDDYISYIPKMEITMYNPETDSYLQLGDKAPNKLNVNVTIPAAEQQRLPVFQNIILMMNVRWTSSRTWEVDFSSDLVFQNIVYIIKFEPIANALIGDLVASQEILIQNEVLVLDASGSYISNMPVIAQKRQIGYDWECPEELNSFCEMQAGNQLFIPFEVVRDSSMRFEVSYQFNLTVIWARPDGLDEKQTLSANATWYNMAKPEFSIEFDPEYTMMTSAQNTLFYLAAQNFAIEDIYDYEVIWTLEPELEVPDNRSILSGGRVMQIIKGSYAENTAYKVTLSVTSTKLQKLTNTQTVEFQTLAPPKGGNVKISPLQGYVGDTFTITLADWTSDNQPIEFNVYTTLDQEGEKKGMIINKEGPIPVNEDFSFTALLSTPVMVSIFDTSGETLEFKLNPQVLDKPPEVNITDTDTNSTDTNSTSGNSTSADDLLNGNGTAGDDLNSTANGGLPDPQALLTQISQASNFWHRVNFMSVAVRQVHDATDDATHSKDQQQIEIRKQLIDELEKQVTEFQKRDRSDPLYMTPHDFLVESFQSIVDLTDKPNYLDNDIAEKCTQVIQRLAEFEDGLLFIILEAEPSYLVYYFASLENLNKFASINSIEWLLQWSRNQLKTTMDLMCTWNTIPELFEYNSHIDELGFSLFRFDQQTALKARRGSAHAIDASYDYNAYQIYGWFTASKPSQLCLQVIGQQFGTVQMRGAYRANSKARLTVSVYEPGSDTTHTMGELSGQVTAVFDLDRSSYASNQTVCMGYAKDQQRWKSDLCQSQLYRKDVQMKCTCNAFSSDHVGIFTDFTRELGEPVVFPEPKKKSKEELTEDISYSALRDMVKPSIAQAQTSVIANDAATGSSFVWMGQALAFSVLTVTGAFIAHRMDQKDSYQKDSQSLALARTGPARDAMQNDFINELANALKEPQAAVNYRKKAIMHYRTIFSRSAFPHLLAQLHPLVSPFTSYCATQSRQMRFTIYMLQFNIVAILVAIYYSAAYRKGEAERDASVIDQSDIGSAVYASLVSSVLLTPWLSEPLIKIFSNKLVTSPNSDSEKLSQTVSIHTRRRGLRITVQAISMLLTLIIPIWAIATSSSVSVASQFCIATTMIGSTFLSTLGTNLLYLWINACLARKVTASRQKRQLSCSSKIVHSRAVQIIRDMKAVNEIKDQFTLGDVLPSSVDYSHLSVCGIDPKQSQSASQSRSQPSSLRDADKKSSHDAGQANQNDGALEELESYQTLEFEHDEANQHRRAVSVAKDSERGLVEAENSYSSNLEVDESYSKHNLLANAAQSMSPGSVPQRSELESDQEYQVQQRLRIYPDANQLRSRINEDAGSSLDDPSSDQISPSKLFLSKKKLGHDPYLHDLEEDSESQSELQDVDVQKAPLHGQHRDQSDFIDSMTKKPQFIMQ